MTQTDRIDGVIADLAIKAPVVVATTANITLSGEQTIDGVAVVEDDRVLVKDQTDTTENGIYDVSTGTWSRSADFDGNRDVTEGTRVYIRSGDTYTGQEWVVSTAGAVTFGTTSIVFEKFSPLIFATIASLTAISTSTLIDGEAFLVLGYYSAGDGGGGWLRWDSDDTTSEDNAFIFEHDNGGTGRFFRVLNGSVTLEQAGAKSDGTETSARIQAALDAGASHGLVVEGGRGKVYSITAGLSWDVVKTIFRGNGCTFDISGASGIVAVTVTNGAGGSSDNQSVALAAISPSGGFSILDDDIASGSTGIKITGTDGTVGAASVKLDGVAVDNTTYGIDLSSATNGAGLTDVTITRARIQSNDYGIYASGNAVASEKIALVDSFIVNSATKGIYINTPLVELNLVNVSVDGGPEDLIYINGGHVTMNGGHLEAGLAYFVRVISTGNFVANGVTVGLPSTVSTAPFNVSSGAGSIIFNSSSITQFTGGSFTPDTIEDGNGRVVFDNCVWVLQSTSQVGPFANKTNHVGNGKFATTNINGWTVDSGTVAHDNAVGKSAVGSIKFSSVVGTAATAHYDIPIRPGMYAGVQGYVQTTNLTSKGATVQLEIRFLDAGGNQVSQVATPETFSTDIASWTRKRILHNLPTFSYAPAGAVTARITITCPAGSGNYEVWFDEIYAFAL